MEDLYLSKEENSSFGTDIKIPKEYTVLLKHFQINGIRFLHNQYILKKGAILNDESGLGKTIVSILYISAIRTASLINNALIICKDINIQHWILHIKEWSNKSVSLYNNENCKSDFFITSSNNLHASENTIWDIILVDDLTNNIFKNLNKIKCKFKIWLTKDNLMMDDIKHLYNILNWITSNNCDSLKNFINKYDSNNMNVIEAWKRQQLLQKFCKLWLLRHTKKCVLNQLPLISSKTTHQTQCLSITCSNVENSKIESILLDSEQKCFNSPKSTTSPVNQNKNINELIDNKRQNQSTSDIIQNKRNKLNERVESTIKENTLSDIPEKSHFLDILFTDDSSRCENSKNITIDKKINNNELFSESTPYTMETENNDTLKSVSTNKSQKPRFQILDSLLFGSKNI